MDMNRDKKVVEELQKLIDTKLHRGYTVDEVVRRVVPHSRELLEALECHVNVEYAHSVELIQCALPCAAVLVRSWVRWLTRVAVRSVQVHFQE